MTRDRAEHALRDDPTWKEIRTSGPFRIRAALTVLCMIVALTVFSQFLEYVEARPGAVLVDPVLLLLPARDVTWLTFSLIYASLVIALVPLLRRPEKFLLAVQGYTLMILFRLVSMYLLPLDPPPGMIPLQDPFVEYFVGSGGILTKDLFFSGHTSTMFLLCLTASSLRFRLVFLLFTMMVGFCVLWQHVHYSVDVLAAPFFAYGAVRIVVMVDGWRTGRRVRS